MINKTKNRLAKVSRVSSRDLVKFRLFAYQTLSLKMGRPKPFEVTIQNIVCHFMLRPVHADATRQSNRGGTYITVDFSLNNGADLLLATRRGT